MKAERIVVSRTDNIGDVVLTFPMLGILKRYYPDSEIVFLGRSYTKAAIEACRHVDGFADWDEVNGLDGKAQAAFLDDLDADVMIHVFPRKEIAAAARRSRIAVRIGSSHRAYHLWNCNRWVNFSRRKSDLHESQLNVKLLQPLGIHLVPMLSEVPALYGLTRVGELRPELREELAGDRMNVILHPMTSGNAKRWRLENYARLIERLPEDRYRFLVTGTAEDGAAIGDGLPFARPNVRSLIGRLTLADLFSVIAGADALVSASTGPLHIAAALGKCAIGIYAPRRIGHPGRFGPVGTDAHALVFDPNCEECRRSGACECLQKVPVSAVTGILEPRAAAIRRSRRAGG